MLKLKSRHHNPIGGKFLVFRNQNLQVSITFMFIDYLTKWLPFWFQENGETCWEEFSEPILSISRSRRTIVLISKPKKNKNKNKSETTSLHSTTSTLLLGSAFLTASELKATGAALAMAAAITDRLLIGDALALVDVELATLAAATAAAAAAVGVVDEPLVAGAPLGVPAPAPAAAPGVVAVAAPPLMFLVASFTSWNFSMNCFLKKCKKNGSMVHNSRQ